MTVRILNPNDWEQLLPDFDLPIGGDRNRSVKIEFNCERPASIHLTYEAGEPDADGVVPTRRVFLATITGWEKVEFVGGPGSVLDVLSDGEVWFFTNDGQYTAAPAILDADGRSRNFVTLLGEQTRSDVIEQMLAAQVSKYNQLRAQQAQERAAYDELAERLAAVEAAGGETIAPSVVTEPAPAKGEDDATILTGDTVSA